MAGLILIVEDGTGLATANTYATLSEADDYHTLRHGLHAGIWQETEEYKKNAALAWATLLLDRHTAWKGLRTTTAQALRWPRTGILTQDADAELAADAIPRWLKDATAELARLLLERDRPVDAELARVASGSSGGRSRSLGAQDSKYKAVIPPSVSAITAPYAIRGVSFLVRAA